MMKRLVVRPELCIGCRSCEERCSLAWRKQNIREKSAIRVDQDDTGNYVIHVCSQCGACAEVCQVQALKRDKKGIIKVQTADCVGCLACVGNCPSETMYYHDELKEPFKCIACGLCAKECPTQCLSIEEY